MQNGLECRIPAAGESLGGSQLTPWHSLSSNPCGHHRWQVGWGANLYRRTSVNRLLCAVISAQILHSLPWGQAGQARVLAKWPVSKSVKLKLEQGLPPETAHKLEPGAPHHSPLGKAWVQYKQKPEGQGQSQDQGVRAKSSEVRSQHWGRGGCPSGSAGPVSWGLLAAGQA